MPRIIFFEALIYASLATKNMLSQYFDLAGYSSVQIGFLMTVLPIVSLASSPFWFKLGSKIGERRIYYIVSIATAFLIWPVFLAGDFATNLLFMFVFSFFFSGIVPIGDSLIMSRIKLTGGRFDRIRLCGTIGFAITSFCLSMVLGTSFIWLFVATSLLVSISAMIIGLKDHGTDALRGPSKKKTTDGTLFEYSIMTAGMFLGITLNSFHNSFIPLLTRERGMDVSAVGVIFAITAVSEIPFLLYADRLISRIGNLAVLEIGMGVIGVRMILISFTTSVVSLYLAETLHGLTYILMYYSLFDYIHFRLPKEHLASAQSVFWVVRSGLTFIAGSIGGGFLIERLSVTLAFRSFGVAGMAAAGIVFFIGLLKRTNSREKYKDTAGG
ncbi:MAG TPA: MFS transporter [Mesotoga sp.]|nr:MFS transporter [Mesotoga sp.]HOY25859.1 MFS transporter [Mesotoga sp.]HPM94960.1 MFS transporter [Mesotoga sp.]